MAGTIIADYIQAAGSTLSMNVGNTLVLTANSSGLTYIPTGNVNVNIGSTASLTLGTLVVSNTATFSNTTTHTGAATFANTLGVTGATTLSSTLAAGNTTITGTLKVSTGAAVGGATPGAGGIAFPATQVSVSNVNTLDDYERGTWTPTLSGATTTTYNSQGGTYIKIGRLVYIEIWLSILSIGDGNTSLIAGAPFTSLSQPLGARGSITPNYWTSAAANFASLWAYINASATTIQFQAASAATTTAFTPTFFGSGTQVSLSGCYYAAA